MEQNSQMQKLDEKLQENAQSMHFSRVPVRIKREFTEWANQEFCGDYGLALRHLWEGRLDVVDVMEQIAQLQQRIIALEQTPKEEPIKKVRMVSGKNFHLRS